MKTNEIPSGLRRCAIVLHALHPEDRQWVLQRLEGGAVEELRRLLDELAELGLPQDPATLQGALAPRPAVRQPPARQIAQALEGEPPALVGIAIREMTPDRQAAVMKHLALPMKAAVQRGHGERASNALRAPRLKAAIDSVLAGQITERARRKNPGRWARLWARLREARS